MSDEPKPKRTRKAKGEPKSPSIIESKFSEETAFKLISIVGRGNFRETACAQVGITSQTLRNWLRQAANGVDPYVDFVARLDKAEAEAESLLVMAVRTAALKGDVKAATWMLERRGAKRWGFRANVEISVEEELARVVHVIEQQLGSEAAARVFAALSDGEVGAGAPDGAGSPEGGPGPTDTVN